MFLWSEQPIKENIKCYQRTWETIAMEGDNWRNTIRHATARYKVQWKNNIQEKKEDGVI